MQVNISAQHFSVDQSMQDYVKDRLQATVKKYFDHPINADIHFTKENFYYHCNLIVNDGAGSHSIIKSQGQTDDVMTTFNMALDNIEKQLRKYKSKINDSKHKKLKASIAIEATKYIIDSNNSEFDDESCEKSPAIIAEKSTDVPQLSVSEAVMQMDLQNLPALMFIHSKSGRMNVVYYRKDGNIAWVDSRG